jgi:amino acid permease
MSTPEEKTDVDPKVLDSGYVAEGGDEEIGVVNKSDPLKHDLQGRHMQMIAIGMFPHFLRLHLSGW